MDRLTSAAAGEVGPVAGEIIGGLRAGGNAAANLFRGRQRQGVIAGDLRGQSRRNRRGNGEPNTAANPVSARRRNVAALLAAKGGEVAKGVGLLKGLKPVVAATKAASGAVKALPGASKTAAAIDAAKTLATENIAPGVLKYGGDVAKATRLRGSGGPACWARLRGRCRVAPPERAEEGASSWEAETGGVLEAHRGR